MSTEQPIVSICCLVYNHEPYLRECFEGFVMQQTTFPIEILVHDDASSDHSADIIREYTAKYPDLFKPIYQMENQYSKGKGFVGIALNLERAKGKYIAMCEGDDYWTDPLKLQKQVEYMEMNEDCGLCYTDYDIYIENNGKYIYSLFKSGAARRSVCFTDHLLRRGYIAPMTWILRKDIYFTLCPMSFYVDASFVIALEFYARSNVAFIDSVTATYRIHNNSASRQIDYEKKWKYQYGLMLTQLEYAKKYGDINLVDKVYMSCFLYEVLPLAIEIDNTAFISEARKYLHLKGIDADSYIEFLTERKNLLKKYNNILNSHSYRLGNSILKPLILIKKLIKKSKQND